MTLPPGQDDFGLGPAMPVYPMAPAATAPPMARPSSVREAFWFTLGGAALFVALAGLWLAVGWDGIRDGAREGLVDEGGFVNAADIDVRARAMAFFVMLFAVLATAPYVTFAALMLRGRNWARVWLTVLVSIGGFVTLIAVFLPYDGRLGIVARLVALVLTGLSVTIVSMLFGRQANQYFR